MIDKTELVDCYKSVLLTLIDSRIDELKFYVSQKAFSHMTISVAFWHYDMHWNIWNKDGLDFVQHNQVSHGEFIILSDFERGNKNVSKLRDIMESWEEEEELSGDEDEDIKLLIRIAHESLALAIESDEIKPLFLDILKETPSFEEASFNSMVRIEDEEGMFDVNFLDFLKK
ncbi:hypothetical protein ACKGLS_000702 [Vibrio alginolyticus]|uniref:hypothetical protein n=1 Tax=Vibrio alginolyticus TaxID=663 RepID=UPI0011F02B81|nr:hypothetical protein [Vibrio alginolyticus]TYZ37972.1 hypothetical protein EWT61_04990 [Vibrio alginolyticus]